MSLQCYNRGCGQKYNNSTNTSESCCHHPGDPFFHDAYKGWSCCKKKCTDFTEFLNIKGCQLSKHCNVKPLEPEKPAIDTTEVIVEVKPIMQRKLERPSIDSALVRLKPIIAASLVVNDINEVRPVICNEREEDKDSNVISIGTTCKNAGCGMVYDGEDSHTTQCIYHPGVPIFHEGLKFWSCCLKRTTDFTVFMNQVGCETGQHIWTKEVLNQVLCRWDHHQTASHVVISIYAKKYCPNQSIIELNPIRLRTKIVFPKQDNASFNLDIELNGVIIIESSSVQMFGTKVEIKLRKAEAGNWPRLAVQSIKYDQLPKTLSNVDNVTMKVDAVDLSDL